jgi:hypothetical protein
VGGEGGGGLGGVASAGGGELAAAGGGTLKLPTPTLMVVSEERAPACVSHMPYAGPPMVVLLEGSAAVNAVTCEASSAAFAGS